LLSLPLGARPSLKASAWVPLLCHERKPVYSGDRYMPSFQWLKLELRGLNVLFYLLILSKITRKAADQLPPFFIPILMVRNGSIWNTNKL
jgi:hypothetical protein